MRDDLSFMSSNGKVEIWNSENDCDQFVFDIAENTRVWRLKKFRNQDKPRISSLNLVKLET